MLAYVYGVVPISLCRGGGCGVSRGKGNGVRIDFDEDDGPITGNERNPLHLTSLLIDSASKKVHLTFSLSLCSGRCMARPEVAQSW